MLQLLSLLGVLQDERVQELLAADLELDLAGLLVALDAGSCIPSVSLSLPLLHHTSPVRSAYPYRNREEENIQEASLRLQISMNCYQQSVQIRRARASW